MKYYRLIAFSSFVFLIVTLLSYEAISNSFKQIRENEYIVASNIFKEVIKRDRDFRLKGHHVRYLTEQSTNGDSIKLETSKGVITYKKEVESSTKDKFLEDKEFTTSQLYLMLKNPIRASVLDSMLRAELVKKGILVQTAVIYEGRLDKTIQKDYSTPDSSFYHTALALLPIHIGIPKLNFEISLKGYMNSPFKYLLKKVPNLEMILVAYGVLLLSFILSVIWCLYMHKKEGGKRQRSDFEIEIADDLVFDKNTGEITSNGLVFCQLREYRMKLFLLLLEAPDHYLDYESIREIIWKDKNVTKERINKTVTRLREDLKDLPIPITIENVRSHGYQINLDPPQDDQFTKREA